MKRLYFNETIIKSLKVNPIVALLGARQVGKTTLAREIAKTHKRVHFFDMEDPVDMVRLENPKSALKDLKGLIIIDEIQRRPEIFPYLRVLADRPKTPARFLILGSSSPHLIKNSSETLAGRISFIEVTPFHLGEVEELQKLHIRGGYPKSYLARSISESVQWRKDYISTFVERDLLNLGISVPPTNIRRFWNMMAHYHGQTWNGQEIGGSLGLSAPTAKRYLDILEGTFVIRQLKPWFANLSKRQVKSPKIYIRDSGLLHSFLGIQTQSELLGHPKAGASWEGFGIESIIKKYKASNDECYFWATHNEAELDLLITTGTKRIGFEFKFGDAPKLTKSGSIAFKDLALSELHYVYPGKTEYKIDKNIYATPLSQFK
jgi:predicted AAA+ superfamily ATPase